MALPKTENYLPLGCLRVDTTAGGPGGDLLTHDSLSPGVWSPTFSSHGSNDGDGDCSTNPPGSLIRIFKSRRPISTYFPLWKEQWILLQLHVSPSQQTGLIRIYILPDDVDRILVDRGNVKLQKLRSTLLSNLDYSRAAWQGDFTAPPLLGPSPVSVQETSFEGKEKGNTSLLRIFNEIPPPSPTLEVVKDLEGRAAILDILSNTVYGLTTSLYPYQRRSAAQIVQREVHPGVVTDPRLRHVLDQDGGHWYYDAMTGTALKEPRYYDGIRGGILAEEMGAGKTVICLAVILATRFLPAKPPDLYRPDSNTPPKRARGTASLLDMAAAAATKYSVPWGHFFEYQKVQHGLEYKNCISAIKKNPGYYTIRTHPPEQGISGRNTRRGAFKQREEYVQAERIIYLSSTSIVIVPANLLQQWQSEIEKHTTGLKVLIFDNKSFKLPQAEVLIEYDVLLFSQWRFEGEASRMIKDEIWGGLCPELSRIRFKRCIVDEGHMIGKSRINSGSRLLVVLASISFEARWIITGTPSTGLYGVKNATALDEGLEGREGDGDKEGEEEKEGEERDDEDSDVVKATRKQNDQERDDLVKLGAMATLYLKARPWANDSHASLDSPADWSIYVMQPHHHRKSQGNEACLRQAMSSLIIRHPFSEVGSLLPDVVEKVVLLEGSYQDKLALNLFSSMIISNAVQSQRTDLDYFFHPRQRPHLLSLVRNLKQASFFGGCFFTRLDVQKAVTQARTFLKKGEVKISKEDKELLTEALRFMEDVVLENEVKEVSNRYGEIPMAVRSFPGPHGGAWALDGGRRSRNKGGGEDGGGANGWGEDRGGGEGEGDALVLLNAPLVRKLQVLTRPCLDAPYSLTMLLNGCMEKEGQMAKEQLLGLARAGMDNSDDNNAHENGSNGNKASGSNAVIENGCSGSGSNTSHPSTALSPTKRKDSPDSSTASKFHIRNVQVQDTIKEDDDEIANEKAHLEAMAPVSSGSGHGASEATGGLELVPSQLQHTRIVATASSKLSYMIDAIVQHQAQDQILVFYENDLTAWYLASALEVLQIKHLIYAKGLTRERRARYVDTFNNSPKFRVLLMDTSLAAFGLDMRAASRIYFVSPVLNPQVEAQAVARARRIIPEEELQNGHSQSQTRRSRPVVHVETLVLRNSVEEVIMGRRREMSRSEHRMCRSLVDDGPIREWILERRLLPLTTGTPADGSSVDDHGKDEEKNDGYTTDVQAQDIKKKQPAILDQMTPLRKPQYVFCRGFGREAHPDEGLVDESDNIVGKGKGKATEMTGMPLRKGRLGGDGGGVSVGPAPGLSSLSTKEDNESVGKPRKRTRFTSPGDDQPTTPLPPNIPGAPAVRNGVRDSSGDIDISGEEGVQPGRKKVKFA